MGTKSGLIIRLETIFQEWERYLSSLPAAEAVAPSHPGAWSPRDVLVHLMAWQQISTARMQAAVDDGFPGLPSWLGGADPFDAEEHTAELNASILELHAGVPWLDVHRAWRAGFQRLVELSRALPEQDMFDRDRYGWLRGYPMAAVIEGSCEHHEEHLAELVNAREA